MMVKLSLHQHFFTDHVCLLRRSGRLDRPVHRISCSSLSNSFVLKNSPSVISKPSQSFLIVTIPGFLLSPLMIFFSVDGGTADNLANALIAKLRSEHSFKILLATTFSVLIIAPPSPYMACFSLAIKHYMIPTIYGLFGQYTVDWPYMVQRCVGMMKKSCCLICQRAEKFPWGLYENSRECEKLKDLLYMQTEKLIRDFGITHFISGMERGAETYAAEIVLQLKKAYSVTLECAIPWEEQAVNWTVIDRDRYFDIIFKSDKETMLQYRFTDDCYQRRNRYMVDQSKHVLAVWDGVKVGISGTIQYARGKRRHICIIDPFRLTATPNIFVWK